jgi:hypothetical protein
VYVCVPNCVCDLETSTMRRPNTNLGPCATEKETCVLFPKLRLRAQILYRYCAVTHRLFITSLMGKLAHWLLYPNPPPPDVSQITCLPKEIRSVIPAGNGTLFLSSLLLFVTCTLFCCHMCTFPYSTFPQCTEMVSLVYLWEILILRAGGTILLHDTNSMSDPSTFYLHR